MNARVLGATGGLVLGLGAAAAVAALLARIATATREVDSYTEDIAGTAEQIVANLTAAKALQRTGELAAGVLALVSEKEVQ